MNWLTFPTPEVAARASRRLRAGRPRAAPRARRAVAAAPCRRPRSRLLARDLGVHAVRRRAADLGRAADLPRPLSHRASPAFALLGAVAILGVGAGTGGARRGRGGHGHRPRRGTRRTRATGAGRLAERRPRRLERQAEADAVVVVPGRLAAAEYYGARPVDVSTADSLWVLVWSATTPRDVEEAERALGFGDHVRVEKLQFGRRLSAQLWRRQP